MRTLPSFVIRTLLVCSILLPATMQTQSQQHTQEKTRTDLSKVCSEKTPPPCATPPRVIYAPETEYSAQARKAHHQGVCTLSVIVEADGRPSDITVSDTLGMGLDEKAIKAVKHWKFAPALKDGKPVPVQIAVEIDFHLAGH